jgi:hypothetical protein
LATWKPPGRWRQANHPDQVRDLNCDCRTTNMFVHSIYMLLRASHAGSAWFDEPYAAEIVDPITMFDGLQIVPQGPLTTLPSNPTTPTTPTDPTTPTPPTTPDITSPVAGTTLGNNLLSTTTGAWDVFGKGYAMDSCMLSALCSCSFVLIPRSDCATYWSSNNPPRKRCFVRCIWCLPDVVAVANKCQLCLRDVRTLRHYNSALMLSVGGGSRLPVYQVCLQMLSASM